MHGYVGWRGGGYMGPCFLCTGSYRIPSLPLAAEAIRKLELEEFFKNIWTYYKFLRFN